MPNGYTEAVKNGSTNVRDYIIHVADRFGVGYAATMQGEKPMPKEFSDDMLDKWFTNYHEVELAKAIDAKNEFDNLSATDLKNKYSEYVKATEESNQSRKLEAEETERRYKDMIAKVEKWNCPADLKGIKDTALQFLNDSIAWDCKPFISEILSYEDWLDGWKENNEWYINYHKEEKSKEDKRKEEYLASLKEFYASLEDFR